MFNLSSFKAKRGFNLLSIIHTAQQLVRNHREESKSLIVLIVPYPTSIVSDEDSYRSRRLLDEIYREIPEVQFLFYGGGALIRFASFVRRPNVDLFPISRDFEAKTIDEIFQRLLNRIATGGC